MHSSQLPNSAYTLSDLPAWISRRPLCSKNTETAFDAIDDAAGDVPGFAFSSPNSASPSAKGSKIKYNARTNARLKQIGFSLHAGAGVPAGALHFSVSVHAERVNPSMPNSA